MVPPHRASPPPLPPWVLKYQIARGRRQKYGFPLKASLLLSGSVLKNGPQTWLKGQTAGIFIKRLPAALTGRTGKSSQRRSLEPAWKQAGLCKLPELPSLHRCPALTPPWEVGVDLLLEGVGFRFTSGFPLEPSSNYGSFVHSVLGRSGSGDLPWEDTG